MLTPLQDAQRTERHGSYPRPHTPNEAPKPWLQSARPSWSMVKCWKRRCDQRHEDVNQSMHQTRMHESLRVRGDVATARKIYSAVPSISSSRHSHGGHRAEQLCRLPHQSCTGPRTPYAVPGACSAFKLWSCSSSKPSKEQLMAAHHHDGTQHQQAGMQLQPSCQPGAAASSPCPGRLPWTVHVADETNFGRSRRGVNIYVHSSSRRPSPEVAGTPLRCSRRPLSHMMPCLEQQSPQCRRKACD